MKHHIRRLPTKAVYAAALISLGAVVACSSGSSGNPGGGPGAPNAGVPWTGAYTCTIAENVTVTAPVMTNVNTSATAGMAVSESGTMLTAALMGDAGLACTLTFADDGDQSGTLSPAGTQSCNLTVDTPVGPQPVTVTFVNGGTAKRTDASLNADDLEISVTDGPGGTLGIQGKGTLSADCTSM